MWDFIELFHLIFSLNFIGLDRDVRTVDKRISISFLEKFKRERALSGNVETGPVLRHGWRGEFSWNFLRFFLDFSNFLRFPTAVKFQNWIDNVIFSRQKSANYNVVGASCTSRERRRRESSRENSAGGCTLGRSNCWWNMHEGQHGHGGQSTTTFLGIFHEISQKIQVWVLYNLIFL